jgi:hypothetical protein
MISRERFDEIMKADHERLRDPRNDILTGLNIMAKYLPNEGIGAAEHDQVWAADVDQLLAAGITEEDLVMLSRLGWFEDADAMTHYA